MSQITKLDKLIANINSLIGPNPDKLEEVICHFKRIQINRNELLLVENTICRDIYFVESGILQVYQIDEFGKEKTLDILLSDDWFTDINSFKFEKPSNQNIRAIKSSYILKINRNSYNELMQIVPKFAEAYYKIIEKKYTETVQRITMLNSMRANEKIKWLRENNPQLTGLLKDSLLSSYLGISKETYSRVKKKIN